MRLQGLIDALSAFPTGTPIEFDTGRPVGHLASWRGSYDELTLTPGTVPQTVGVVLADAVAALDRTFQGYKGGDYTMYGGTPVWGDDYGDYECRGIMGHDLSLNGVVVLFTADLSDYR